jgi:RNase P/RNase MRP subunit p29
MLTRNIIPDRTIDQKVGQQLVNHGVRPPCKVVASSNRGMVTLTGKIQHEHQRNLCVQTARRVEGVQRVVDQLQVIVREVKKDKTHPGHYGEVVEEARFLAAGQRETIHGASPSRPGSQPHA